MTPDDSFFQPGGYVGEHVSARMKASSSVVKYTWLYIWSRMRLKALMDR
jgi:hypothetical protein